MSRLLSVVEVQRMLDLESVEAVYRLARLKIIPAVRIGRRIKFSEDQLTDFVDKGGKSYEKKGA